MKEKLGGLNVLYPTLTTIVGAIAQTHVDESVLTDGKADISKVKTLLLDMTSKKYWSLGDDIARCRNVGKN